VSRSRLIGASVAVAVVVSVGILAPSLVGARVFHATDLLERYAPWSETQPDGVKVTNPLVSDTVDDPTRFTLRDRAADGVLLPLWEGRILGGIALGSIPNSSLMSPLNFPYRVLPPWYAPALVKLLELATAIGFSYLYLRRISLGATAAALGGLIYAFSGFQVAWTNWSQAHIGALIPGLFWGVEYAIQKRTPIAALPAAGVVAVMWLEGFPAVTGFALAFAAVYTLVRIVDFGAIGPAVRRGGIVLGGVVLGTALAAFQLVPFAFWLAGRDLATRVQNPGWTLSRRTLATLAVPDAFGNPVDGLYYGPADYLIYGPVNWVENQAFIGIAALGLIGVAAVYGTRVLAGRSVAFLWGSTGVCVLLIYLGGPLLSLFQRFPLFGLNHIGRLRSVLLFLLAVLAAVGAEAILRGLPLKSSRRDQTLLVLAIVAIATVVGLGLVKAGEMAAEAGATDYFRDQLAVAAVVALVVAAILFAAHGRWAGAAFAVLPLVVAFEIVSIAGPWWPQIPEEQFYPATTTHQYLLEHLDGDRIAATEQTTLPSTNILYDFRSVSGHAFHTGAWADLMRATDPGAFRLSPTYSSLAHDAAIVSSPVLDRLGVRFVVADPRRPVFGSPALSPTQGTIVLDDGAIVQEKGVPGIGGIELTLGETYVPQQEAGTITLRLLSSDGSVLTTSRRRLTRRYSAGPLQVAVVDPGTETVASMEIVYTGDAPLVLATRRDGSVVTGVVAADNELRVVHAEGAVVYERPNALPRIRWASQAIVIADPDERIAALQSTLPEGSVVLSAPGPEATGEASLDVVEDDGGDRIEVRVTAASPGYLVIADSLTTGWRATVDGAEADIAAADHAGAAVHVPSGEHTVVLSVAPEGWTLGWVVTLLALVIVIAIAVLAVRSRPKTD